MQRLNQALKKIFQEIFNDTLSSSKLLKTKYKEI